MSDTTTPETDQEEIVMGRTECDRYVLAEFARRLERERDEALMDRANGDMATMTINHYERLIKERDEARADAARIADILSGLELRSTDELARLEQERDEARAVAGELADVASKYLSFLLAVTPAKTNETHEKKTMRVIDAIKRWKKL
jgi:hypothetical protein